VSTAVSIALRVNGRQRTVAVQPEYTLLEVLRDYLDLKGAKRGCNQGVCGACTVLADGRPIRSCISLAIACTHRDITTVEGLATGGLLTPVQQAMMDAGAVQCGFCTSGVILSAHALLQRSKQPSMEEIKAALSGNLCRCSGYKKIVNAIRAAAEKSA
jgi:aerobic carbon-monoxide dehydrogenase small subunit